MPHPFTRARFLVLAQFRDLRVRVVAADGTDLTAADEDPTRVLIRQVLGAVAQFGKSVIVVAKLRAARLRRRRATSRCEGRKPFGVRPGEEMVLARMRQLRRKPRGRDRLSFGAIAARLNTKRRTTRTGAPWRAGTVRKILQRARG